MMNNEQVHLSTLNFRVKFCIDNDAPLAAVNSNEFAGLLTEQTTSTFSVMTLHFFDNTSKPVLHSMIYTGVRHGSTFH